MGIETSKESWCYFAADVLPGLVFGFVKGQRQDRRR
jgi:hypothetical protein